MLDTHTHMCVCIYIHMCVREYTHTCVCVHKQRLILLYMMKCADHCRSCACFCTCIFTHTSCTYIHIYLRSLPHLVCEKKQALYRRGPDATGEFVWRDVSDEEGGVGGVGGAVDNAGVAACMGGGGGILFGSVLHLRGEVRY
jgi:hypothetical protein